MKSENKEKQQKDAAAQTSDSLYLQKLEFDPELKKSWLNFFVSRSRVVLLMIMIISITGIASFLRLPRESNPEVKIPIAVVATTYPGVSPTDIEELITKKVETDVSAMSGIKRITSSSQNSISIVTVEFESSENVDDAIGRLKDTVSTISDLPDDATEPEVLEISADDSPIWTFQLSGPQDGLELRHLADEIKEELEKINGVREVIVSGGDEIEIEIAYDPQKLAEFNVAPSTVTQVLQSTNIVFPAGTYEGESFTYTLRTDSRFYNAESIRSIPISHAQNGSQIFIKDIASVREKTKKRTILSRLSVNSNPPQESVTIDVIKKTGGSIIDVVDRGHQVVNDLQKTFPPGTEVDTIIDFSKQIERDFNQLSHDFYLTLFLVGAILFLIVGLKEALVAMLAVPLVFFATFTVMLYSGISLNFLSLFSLILSLGVLVDDAIVVVSATKQYLKSGKFTPEEAVLLVLRDFKVVLTTSTLTTIWAFLPLLMATGIIGLFIRSIPITVSVTLFASLIIALMINHPLAAALERVRLTPKLYFFYILSLFGLGAVFLNNDGTLSMIIGGALVAFGIGMIIAYGLKLRPKLKENKRLVALEKKDDELIKQRLANQSSKEESSLWQRLLHGIIHFDKLLGPYETVLRFIVKTKLRRWLTLLGTLLLFISAVTLPVTGLLKSEFFPLADTDNVFIGIEAPIGQNLDLTNETVKEVERRIEKFAEVKSYSTLVGSSAVDLGLSSGIRQTNSHIASITINLVDLEERDFKSYDITPKFRDALADITSARVVIQDVSGGPPQGSAVQARIIGEDLQILDRIANDLKPMLADISGVVNVDISLKNSPAEITYQLDPKKLDLYNLSAAQVGSTLRMAISGTEVTTVIREGDEISVVARIEPDKIPTLDAVQALEVSSRSGQSVFMRDVMKPVPTPSIEAITRIDQKRYIQLSSGVTSGTISGDVVKEFQGMIDEYDLPDGYSVEFGGENEENAESVRSILEAMLLAIFLIVATMVIQFNSFRKALIVIVAIPLALIGVFYGLTIFGLPLSFPGLIGILALFGIVVKNSIILIDKMNLNLKAGIPFVDAIVDAGKSRFEAIFMTSLATVFGIIPITLSNEVWTALGGAIIFGLLLSSFFTLFIVPTLFIVMVPNTDED